MEDGEWRALVRASEWMEPNIKEKREKKRTRGKAINTVEKLIDEWKIRSCFDFVLFEWRNMILICLRIFIIDLKKKEWVNIYTAKAKGIQRVCLLSFY